MSIWAVGGKAGAGLISNEESGLGVFGNGDLAGEAEAAHDLIGSVLDGRGAHAGNGEGREANHHADNGDDDQKLDEGEGGHLAQRRRGAEGEALAREWEGMDANGEAGEHQGRGRSPRWIPFVALWLRERLCFHSRGFA